jgi:hypothetical protein
MDSAVVAIFTILLPVFPVIVGVLINGQWNIQKEAELLEPWHVKTSTPRPEFFKRLSTSYLHWEQSRTKVWEVEVSNQIYGTNKPDSLYG